MWQHDTGAFCQIKHDLGPFQGNISKISYFSVFLESWAGDTKTLIKSDIRIKISSK